MKWSKEQHYFRAQSMHREVDLLTNNVKGEHADPEVRIELGSCCSKFRPLIQKYLNLVGNLWLELH